MSEKLIPTWKERLAHLDKPTDFAEAQAAKMEADELRRYIRELESASQPGGEPAAYIRADHLAKARVAPYLCRVEPTLRDGMGMVPIYAGSQPGGGEEPEWIVNDLGELGVHIGLRFFFLYKGDNIEYGKDQHKNGIALHDDGTPMQYRIVGKREFGETCLPMKWLCEGSVQPRYTEELVYTPGLSFGRPEDGEWRVLPAAPSAGNAEEA